MKLESMLRDAGVSGDGGVGPPDPTSAVDPRGRPGFESNFFPLADGVILDSERPIPRWGCLQLEFCCIYYELNRLAEALERVRRATGGGRIPDTEVLSEAMAVVLRQRASLEDRWAPMGVAVEPVMKRGRAVDIRFTFPDVDRAGKPRLEGCGPSSAATLLLPLDGAG